MVALYYWNSLKNAGDYFSYWLCSKLYSEVRRSEASPTLITSGSILGHKLLTNNTIVWGSGWHNAKWSESCRITNKDNFRAVRGKLTAEYLKLDIKKVALGDPGLLASKFFKYKDIVKQRKILILSHWRDYESLYKQFGNQYTVINMATNDVEAIFKAICESDFVLSSSLHGIIFAHSFGVPALHLEVAELESKDNFKFKDYYSVLDIKYKKIKAADNPDLDLLYNTRFNYLPKQQVIKNIQADLLKALPKESEVSEKIACLCAIAKNENNYLKEWVEHHKALGFDHIFLFDNNDINGEHFNEVIDDYIKANYVTVFDVRGLENQQIKCYNDFYHSSFANQYSWVAFFDIDEFLYLDNNKNINEWLLDKKYNSFDGIAINWKYFDDNNLIKVENNNYSIKRFTHEFQEKDWEWAQHRFSKRLIRTGLSLTVNSSHGPIATAQMNEYNNGIKNTIKVCNIAGEPLIANKLAFNNWTYAGGYLAHYRYKTIEEFITNKMKRGYPTLYKNSGKDLSFVDFFKLNTLTPEKINYIANLTKQNEKIVEKACKEAWKNEEAKIKLTESKEEKNKKADLYSKSNSYLYF